MQSVRFEVLIDGEDGERCFGCSVAPLFHGEEPQEGSVVAFQDLTEVRALEAEVHRSERLASLGEFAAGLAHELRNPLGSLSGCV